MKELDELKAHFLTDDLDEETRADNEAQIRAWENALIQNENFAGWVEHDITRLIVSETREAYKNHALQLATSRTLTEAQRQSLFAKQDACLFLLNLIEKDAKGTLEQIHREIRAALNAL